MLRCKLGKCGLSTDVHFEQVAQREVFVALDRLADCLLNRQEVTRPQRLVAQTRDARHDGLEAGHLLAQARHHLVVRQSCNSELAMRG